MISGGGGSEPAQLALFPRLARDPARRTQLNGPRSLRRGSYPPNLPAARLHLRAQTLPMSGYKLGPRLSIGLTLIFLSEYGLQPCRGSRYKADAAGIRRCWLHVGRGRACWLNQRADSFFVLVYQLILDGVVGKFRVGLHLHLL